MVGGGKMELKIKVLIILGDLFREVAFPKYIGILMVGVMVFLGLSGLNVLGLFPFVFSVTRHLVISFGLGFVMWFSFFLVGWTIRIRRICAHLVPEGSPLGLAPFMVLVELISHFIRPITLSVRLVANIVAGHLILGLISSVRLVRRSGFFFSVFFQRVILVMEWIVMFIQAFVFGILLVLYMLDYR